MEIKVSLMRRVARLEGPKAEEGGGGLYLGGEERFGGLSTFFYVHFARRWLRALHAFAQNKVLEEARRTGAKRLLEVGSGPGWVVCELARLLPDATVVGVDPSPQMVEYAKKYAAKLGVPNAHFHLGSSRSLPEESFDVAYSVLSFHHWANKEESLKTIFSHLSGEKFMVFEYNRDTLPFYMYGARAHSLSPATLQELQRASPFPKVVFETKGPLLLAAFVKS